MENAEKKVRIIIDTDIGDDIDDAFAIALALELPEIEIVGITTVFKNTQARAELVLAELEQYGRLDIPVYAGCQSPLIERVDVTEIPCQNRALNKEYGSFSKQHAVAFIIEQLKINPDIILVGLGAMTNIAMAMRLAPEVMKNVKIASMGGVFCRMEVEWNIFCDPEAAKIVLESGNEIMLAGEDVTMDTILEARDLELIKTSRRPQAEFLRNILQCWFDTYSTHVILHDPLVIAWLVHPEFLTFYQSKVCVELHGEHTRGLTYRDNHNWGEYIEGSVKVGKKVEARAFIDWFMEKVFR